MQYVCVCFFPWSFQIQDRGSLGSSWNTQMLVFSRLPFKWPDGDDVTGNVLFFFKIWPKDSFALLHPTFFCWPWGERGAKGVEKEVRKEQKAKLKVTWMKAGDTLFINIYPESNCGKSKTMRKIFQPSVSISYSKKGIANVNGLYNLSWYGKEKDTYHHKSSCIDGLNCSGSCNSVRKLVWLLTFTRRFHAHTAETDFCPSTAYNTRNPWARLSK